MLLNELGAEELEQRRLICGNPYSFQGDERHIIFLSMVASPNERIGAFTKPADQRRFNVAASRAQDQMWLFHTATRSDLSEVCLRRRLLEHFENPTSHITGALGEDAEQLRQLAHSANRQVEKPPRPFDSWFEVDVALRVGARGYRIIPQYPFGGKVIDLVIEGAQSQLAVECDGDHWHGPEQYEQDMERQRILERCGWHFHRIRECLFNANPEEALRKLWDALDRRGIRPISQDESQGKCPRRKRKP
jgi:very-short-patch-repair endonuclease